MGAQTAENAHQNLSLIFTNILQGSFFSTSFGEFAQTNLPTMLINILSKYKI